MKRFRPGVFRILDCNVHCEWWFLVKHVDGQSEFRSEIWFVSEGASILTGAGPGASPAGAPTAGGIPSQAGTLAPLAGQVAPGLLPGAAAPSAMAGAAGMPAPAQPAVGAGAGAGILNSSQPALAGSAGPGGMMPGAAPVSSSAPLLPSAGAVLPKPPLLGAANLTNPVPVRLYS